MLQHLAAAVAAAVVVHLPSVHPAHDVSDGVTKSEAASVVEIDHSYGQAVHTVKSKLTSSAKNG